MTEILTYPGNYALKQFTISPIDQTINSIDKSLNISPIIPKISITESINNDSIRGYCEVFDTIGVLDQYPLRGEERITMEIEDSIGNTKIYDLFLYKVDEVATTPINDGVYYKIHFVSYKRFLSDKTRLVKSYEAPVSSIVQDVFTYFYGSKGSTQGSMILNSSPLGEIPSGVADLKTEISNTSKKITDVQTNSIENFSYNELTNNIEGNSNYLEDQSKKSIIVEPTEDMVRLIIPNMSPVRTMKMLENRAYSQTSPSCSFRFFESSNSFYFVSDEYLFSRNSVPKDFTFAEHIPYTPEFFDQHMSNFSELTNSNRFDTFEDMHNGGYHSKVIVMDILKKTVNLKDAPYKYSKNKTTFFDTSIGQTVSDRHSDNFMDVAFTDENARQFIVVRDYETETGGQLKGEQHFPDIINNRLAYRHHLNTVVLYTKGHGRLDLTCGDLINLNINETTSETGQPKTNEQLSGNYIIEEVVHVFDKGVGENHYKLLKRNWGDVEDTKTSHFLKTGLDGL